MAEANAFEESFARLVRLTRTLPDVENSTSENAPALKIADSLFVRLAEPTLAVLHCPLQQKILLMEISPEIFFETDHYIGKDEILVRLDKIDDEELALKLEDAWAFKAPEHLKSKKA